MIENIVARTFVTFKGKQFEFPVTFSAFAPEDGLHMEDVETICEVLKVALVKEYFV